MEVTTPKKIVSEEELQNMSLSDVLAAEGGNASKSVKEIAEAHSLAAERLARLKKRRNTPEYVPMTVAGENLFIKSLTAQELTDLALSVGRDGVNVLQINNDDGVRKANIAIYMKCVYDAPDQPSFTNPDDVGTYLDSPDAIEFLSGIMDKIAEVNPCIFATLKKT